MVLQYFHASFIFTLLMFFALLLFSKLSLYFYHGACLIVLIWKKWLCVWHISNIYNSYI